MRGGLYVLASRTETARDECEAFRGVSAVVGFPGYVPG